MTAARPDSCTDVDALTADLARALDAALEGTSEHRCAVRAAAALADGRAALGRAREQLGTASDRFDLALTAAKDPRPHRAELVDAARAAEDVALWVVCLEREHLRAQLELCRRRDKIRRALVRGRRADVAARCGAAGAELLTLDAADERLCAAAAS